MADPEVFGCQRDEYFFCFPYARSSFVAGAPLKSPECLQLVAQEKGKTQHSPPFEDFINLSPCPSTTTFHHMSNCLLSPCYEYVIVYIDCVAVFSDLWGEHLKHLHPVFL
uniref:Uncharacterized protein n=1 Tax=Sphaerodactylus townsendi TaxID=933632 RepID=A0ACB8F1J3_9SAUR